MASHEATNTPRTDGGEREASSSSSSQRKVQIPRLLLITTSVQNSDQPQQAQQTGMRKKNAQSFVHPGKGRSACNAGDPHRKSQLPGEETKGEGNDKGHAELW